MQFSSIDETNGIANGISSAPGAVLDVAHGAAAHGAAVAHANGGIPSAIADVALMDHSLRAFLESLDEIAISLDSHGDVRFCNGALLHITGYAREEVIGRNWFSGFLPAPENAFVSQVFEALLQPEKASAEILQAADQAAHRENEIVTKSGARRLIAWNNIVLRNGETVTGVLALGEDITERSQQEATLRQREMLLQTVFENAGAGMAVIGLDRTIVEANGALCDFLGYARDEILQMRFGDLTHRDDFEACLRSMEQLKNGETGALQLEKRYIHRAGHIVWGAVNLSLARDGGGVPLHFIAQVQDITARKREEDELRASENFVRSALDGLREHVAILDESGAVLTVNQAWRAGGDNAAPLCANIQAGADYLALCQAESGANAVTGQRIAVGVRKVLSGEESEFCLEYACHKISEQRWFAAHATRFGIDGSNHVIVTHENITESKLSEENLRESKAILEATQEASADGIFLVDNRGIVVRCNKRFAGLWNIEFEYTETLRAEQRLLAFVLEQLKAPDEFIGRINYLYDHPHASTRDEIYLKDGRVFDRYSAPAISAQGHSYGRVWSFSDITSRKVNEDRLAHQAFHDVLTGLPNRALFLDRLERALTRARRHTQYPAVLFLDLDRFKLINDSLGHEAGDQLLVAVAERLRVCLRPEDTAARLGGDEFTILLETIGDVSDATRIAERVAEELRAPFLIGGHEVFSTCSVGIALGAGAEERADTLMRNADAAMYLAKSRGKAHYEVFDNNLTTRALEHLEFENDLRRSVTRGEFKIVYQPIIGLGNGAVVGAEALIRWQHPQRGIVSPGEFIPLAEETGLILPIGQWVLREACRQACAWRDENPGAAPCSISVNLSARQFGQPNLIEEIAEVIKETGIEPRRLVLEITESVVMESAESTIRTLQSLKKLGVQLAIDDFGTGYSSLSYLKRFPVDTLKVDRSFVSGLGIDSEDSAIVRAVVTLAKTLGMTVTAEGVETPGHLAQLQKLECDYGQGYLFDKPLAPAEFAARRLKKQAAPAVPAAPAPLVVSSNHATSSLQNAGNVSQSAPAK